MLLDNNCNDIKLTTYSPVQGDLAGNLRVKLCFIPL